ncbi:hypothetical protein KC19_9G137700 [Ceratodon purpureus]|uniref:Uncharacterized protein n=1 Tax=Ceratodon purpureus TaxID=3225 RepID=A0A8T0GTJ8_CERPU|nr:hypothetical protein KC19_9G137700 [Ceratodon purpureus]
MLRLFYGQNRRLHSATRFFMRLSRGRPPGSPFDLLSFHVGGGPSLLGLGSSFLLSGSRLLNGEWNLSCGLTYEPHALALTRTLN